jgi:endonuclease/exonuclease/phosphatase family metal-dependent hydrolase
LKLLSFNIQAGSHTRGYHDYLLRSWQQVLPHKQRWAVLDRMAELLQGYDVVGLQESDSGSLRSGRINQTAYLAERAGFAYFSHQANRRVAGIAYPGNGLLLRERPTRVEDHVLPGLKGRGALLADIGRGKHKLSIVVTHLSLSAKARARQFAFLQELLADAERVVLMGDLNAEVSEPAFAEFLVARALVASTAHPSYPAWKPKRAIDHILLSRSLLTTQPSTPLAAQLSDHLPVHIELQRGVAPMRRAV